MIKFVLTFLFSWLTMTTVVNAQEQTLYYNEQGELTIYELATHYRKGIYDTLQKKFTGIVQEYRPDSSRLSTYNYSNEGILEGFIIYKPNQDTLLYYTHGTDGVSSIPDSIASILNNKHDLKPSLYIRKNDYPLIKKQLTSIQFANDTKDFIDGDFVVVEDPAKFPGGFQKVGRFLSLYLSYPSEAKQNGITGKVYVRFKVYEDGTIGELESIKKLGYGCDEIAIEAVRKLPDWKPGYQHGIPQPQVVVLPITFE